MSDIIKRQNENLEKIDFEVTSGLTR